MKYEDTVEDAFTSYKTTKEKHARIDERVIYALDNWTLEDVV